MKEQNYSLEEIFMTTNTLATNMKTEEQIIKVIDIVLGHALYETKKRALSLGTNNPYEPEVESVMDKLAPFDSHIVFEGFAKAEQIMTRREDQDIEKNVKHAEALHTITMTSIAFRIMTKYYEEYTCNQA